MGSTAYSRCYNVTNPVVVEVAGGRGCRDEGCDSLVISRIVFRAESSHTPTAEPAASLLYAPKRGGGLVAPALLCPVDPAV